MRICYKIKSGVEALEEPDDDSCDEDYGEGLLKEVLGLFPHELQCAAEGRKPVVRKLHNKRRRFALEEYFFVDECDEDADHDAQEIKACHDEAAFAREECIYEECVDRELCGAAHKWSKNYCHLTVSV